MKSLSILCKYFCEPRDSLGSVEEKAYYIWWDSELVSCLKSDPSKLVKSLEMDHENVLSISLIPNHLERLRESNSFEGVVNSSLPCWELNGDHLVVIFPGAPEGKQFLFTSHYSNQVTLNEEIKKRLSCDPRIAFVVGDCVVNVKGLEEEDEPVLMACSSFKVLDEETGMNFIYDRLTWLFVVNLEHVVVLKQETWNRPLRFIHPDSIFLRYDVTSGLFKNKRVFEPQEVKRVELMEEADATEMTLKSTIPSLHEFRVMDKTEVLMMSDDSSE